MAPSSPSVARLLPRPHARTPDQFPAATSSARGGAHRNETNFAVYAQATISRRVLVSPSSPNVLALLAGWRIGELASQVLILQQVSFRHMGQKKWWSGELG